MHKLHFSDPVQAFISNCQCKKENHGEDLVNRLDINFEITVDRDKVGELFLEPEAIQRGLWDEDGMVLDGEIGIALNSVAESQVVDIAGHRFGGAKVKLTAANPQPGWTVEIKGQAQVYPGSTKEGKLQIGDLHDKQRRDVPLSITNQQADIDE